MGKIKNRIMISGYYGFNNSGDEAILKAIVSDIKKINENVEIIALSKSPHETSKLYGIKCVNRFNLADIIKEIRKCDIFISGGGSLLQDVTSTRSIFYYLALIWIAKLNKKPVMIYANGIGPIRKKANRILTKNVLEKVDLITLRDENSRKTIESLGVKNKNIFVTADPVYTLESSSKAKVYKIFEREVIPCSKPIIGIAVREWHTNSEIVEIVSKAIDYIIQNYGVNILLIPMHYPNDLKISREILNRSKSSQCYLLKRQYSVEDIMGIIGSLDLIIAMRLHTLIYAASQAVPMIGLVYDPKVEGFFESIGLDTKCMVKDLEFDKLCMLIDKAWSNRDEVKNKLENIKLDFKEKALENVLMAIKLLEGR